MKDPREKLYTLLEAAPENAELMTDVKAYMAHIIGQSATAKSAAAAEITALKSEHEQALAALKSAPPAEGFVSQADFVALKKDYDAGQEALKSQAAAARSGKLSKALNGQLAGIDEDYRNAIVTSMKTKEGYAMGGKTFKASNDGEGVVITVDGESVSLDSGMTALMQAGLSNKVQATQGGGMPNIDGKKSDNVSLSDAVNAVYKK